MTITGTRSTEHRQQAELAEIFETYLRPLAHPDVHFYQVGSVHRLEKKALAYADAMTAQPPTVTDEQVAELDRELGHKGLVELSFAIAVENMRARCYHALGITDQGFTSGEACAIPTPVSPAAQRSAG